MMMTIMLVAHRNYRHVMLAIFSTTFLLLLSVDEVRALIAIPPTASPVIHYRHLDRVGGSSSRNVAIKNNFGIHNNHHPSWSSSYSTTKTTRTTSLAAGVMMSTSTAAASTTATYYTRLLLMTTLQQLRGGEVSDLAMNAYEWCHNLSSPAALIAGAVVATIYENMGSGALDINASKDSKWVIFGKRCCRLLLLSAFACEVLSIFITTVTGTMLLSHTEASLDAYNLNKMVSKYTTPLSFLHDNFEFEYLTARITFLQGLLNWLGAIALGHILPSGESTDSRVMNQFIGASLLLRTYICCLLFFVSGVCFLFCL